MARRDRETDLIFTAGVVLSVLTLLWLGRGLTFFADEWAFIADRSLADPST